MSKMEMLCDLHKLPLELDCKSVTCAVYSSLSVCFLLCVHARMGDALLEIMCQLFNDYISNFVLCIRRRRFRKNGRPQKFAVKVND